MSSLTRPERSELEDFLYREARLLDEQRWDEWAELFTEDGTYWVPASPEQSDPINHVSLIYEDRLLRAVRIERYKDPNAFSLQPMPRSVHLVSNVVAEAFDAETDECLVRSSFIMLEFQRDTQRTYGGIYTHRLKRIDGQWRIRHKRVDLVNCDGPQWSMQIYP